MHEIAQFLANALAELELERLSGMSNWDKALLCDELADMAETARARFSAADMKDSDDKWATVCAKLCAKYGWAE